MYGVGGLKRPRPVLGCSAIGGGGVGGGGGGGRWGKRLGYLGK